jgi:glycosyltransferase involved in cell wall biosynthesis
MATVSPTIGVSSKPLVTIVTPTIDGSTYVDEAVDSVPLEERYLVEHIVVHDGSHGFVERLAADYPWLRFVPGEGRGATAAVVLGTAAAAGEFILYLGSDDRLLRGALTALAKAAAERPEIDVWTGGTRIFAMDVDAGTRTVRTLDDPGVTALNLGNVLDDVPLMTARFIRRAVYEWVGPLDERFSVCSDREFALRMILAGVREAALAVRVSELRMHKESFSVRPPGRWVPAYLDAHVELAWRHMSDRAAAPDVRAALRDWHARETLRKIYYEACAGEIVNFRRSLAIAFARDWAWPWRALSSGKAHRLRQRGLP